jgi:hypothetical protein
MFSAALGEVEKYTLPVIFSRRLFNGQIGSACGTFIVVNREGWILTAAHIAKELSLHNVHAPEIQAFHQKHEAIANDPSLNDKAKRKQLKLLKSNPHWVTDQAVRWGGLQAEINCFGGDEFADIAVGKLEPFDPAWIKGYPVFKNPAEPMPAGTSLCRLGFPFHQIEATFDVATKRFALSPKALPIPRFPNDGIHTRIVVLTSPDGSRNAKLLETSTPGLKGQSGGPIFDRNGHVWALQVRTQSLSLGFAPEIVEGNRKTVEHQFMHVGWGTHVEEIISLFRKHGVAFTLSS